LPGNDRSKHACPDPGESADIRRPGPPTRPDARRRGARRVSPARSANEPNNGGAAMSSDKADGDSGLFLSNQVARWGHEPGHGQTVAKKGNEIEVSSAQISPVIRARARDRTGSTYRVRSDKRSGSGSSFAYGLPSNIFRARSPVHGLASTISGARSPVHALSGRSRRCEGEFTSPEQILRGRPCGEGFEGGHVGGSRDPPTQTISPPRSPVHGLASTYSVDVHAI